MEKKPTLRDIAKHADVALSTVSMALNNRPGVSSKMRQRILDAARVLGYTHKVTSEYLPATDIKTIGVLTKRHNKQVMIINPFYSYIIAGAEHECSRYQINLMYANVEVDESNRVRSMPPMLLDEHVDGIIVLGTLLEETLAHISRYADNRIVLVDAYSSNGNGFDSVLIDNISGSQMAINHLIENGHRHIGLIGSEAVSYPSVQERRQTYLNVLAQHNLPLYIEDGILQREDAYIKTKQLLKRAPEITAIFACNDEVAIGAINAIQDMGLRVPDDISLVGFDDIDMAKEVVPALTTIHVDKVLMGTMAVRHIRDRVLEPERTPLKTLVGTKLVERNSVRRLT